MRKLRIPVPYWLSQPTKKDRIFTSRCCAHKNEGSYLMIVIILTKNEFRVWHDYHRFINYGMLLFFHTLITLRPRQNGRHFAGDIFKCILLNKDVWIPNKISLKFVPKGLINNIPSLVQIMAWRRPGGKPLSEPIMFSLPTHICVIRPQWIISTMA